MFRSATLPHIRKTASTSATPTFSGDIEKTYVLVQKLVWGDYFKVFIFLSVCFLRTVSVSSETNNLRKTGRLKRDRDTKYSLTVGTILASEVDSNAEENLD